MRSVPLGKARALQLATSVVLLTAARPVRQLGLRPCPRLLKTKFQKLVGTLAPYSGLKYK